MKTAKRYLIAVLSLLAITVGHALAAPGAWDRTYAPTVSSGPIYAMGLQTDGKLVVGGAFTAVDGSSSRARLARLFSDGSLDTTFFNTGSGVFGGNVWSLAMQTDSRIVIGGDFTSINGTTRTRVARLNSNGTVDGSFVPTNTINGSVLAVAVQTNNAVVIGGSFNTTGFPSWNARLNADGTTDTSFSSFPNGSVNAIAIQTDGKIVIGGAFTSVNGATRNRIARLNSDGSLDNTFQNSLTGASSTVRCLQIQSDGKILIGGDFTTVNGTTRNFVARLNSNGSLDTGFNSSPGANNSVYALAVQPDNSVVIGGSFTSYASANLSRVARLYADGTRDTTFTNFGINNIVESLAIQSDGGTLIGGTFTTINNTNWSFLGRLYGNLYPPEFVIQPVSRGTNVGANVTFSAQVSNPTVTSFQWRKDGINISGATGTAYSLFNVQFSDAGNYSVFVSDPAGGTTSSNALLQVGIAPAITSQTGSLTVTQGQSASFSVTATGTPLNYFWKKSGTFIIGETNSSLNFANVVATNAATYTCQVSNFVGSVTSTGAVLTVYYPPTISVQPVGQTIAVGSAFTVGVIANGYPTNLAYQWRTNTIEIAGATNSSYSVTNAQTYNMGSYDVVITNSMGGTNSNAAVVNVGYAPVIVQQPLSLTNLVGGTASFSCLVTGTAPINLQWTLNGYAIAMQTNLSITLTNLQTTNIGFYALAATNVFGSAVSSNALLNLNGFNFVQWAGLEAYYPFNNGDVSDASGNGNNGTNFGAVATSDRFGNTTSAMLFNGSGNYIQCKTGAYFGSNFTVSAWVDATAYHFYSRIFDFGNGAPLDNTLLALSYMTTGLPDFYAANGNAIVFEQVASSTIPLNTWVHVVACCDGNQAYFYTNGILENHWIVNLSRQAVTTTNNYFGKSNNNADAYYLGMLDDIRIYNRALLSDEVAYLYALESQSTVPPSPTLAASLSAGPAFNLNLAGGLPGSNYVLQTATNLLPPIQWLPVLTNAADTNGVWQFTDTNLNSAQKFYRVTTP